MKTGNLTPRSESIIFGQPDGFNSILVIDIRKSGKSYLTISWRDSNNNICFQSVGLSNEQRKQLASVLLSYEPTLWEEIQNDHA